MGILDRRSLKAYAAEKLGAQEYPARRLALIYAGTVALVQLAVMGINYYVNRKLEAITGLSGMGTASVLETVQQVLSFGVSIAMPFWSLGFVFAMLGVARGQQMQPGALLEGFRRFGPALGLMLLRGLIYGVIGMLGVYLGVLIYMATPLAKPLFALTMPLAESAESTEQMLEAAMQIPMEELMAAVMPAYIIILPVCGLLILPVFYSFRLAEPVVMDVPRTGALAALLTSGGLTRRHRMELFRLDLSFWWYYAGLLIGSLLCSAGAFLPVTPEAYLGCYAAGQAIQALVICLGGGYVHTTWAAAYDALRQAPPQEKKPAPAPQKLPWDEYK